MATIISKQSGPWSSASSWNEGKIPSGTDEITIATGHTIKLVNDFSVAKSLTVNGSLDLDNATLAIGVGLKSSSYSDGVLTLGAGASITGQGKISPVCGRICSAATSDNWASVGGAVQFYTPGTQVAAGKVNFELAYVSFTSSVDQIFSTQGNDWSSGSFPQTLIFSHCVFNGPKNIDFGQSGYTRGETEIDIQYCDFRNCMQVKIAGIQSDRVDEARNLKYCTFYNSDGTPCLISYLRFMGSLDMTGTVGVRVKIQGNPVDIADSFFLNDNISNPLLAPGANANTIADSYFYTLAAEAYNPKLLTGASLKNIVHEGPRNGGGNGFGLFGGAMDFEAENILSIGRGFVITPQSTNVNASIRNVTKVVAAEDGNSPVLLNGFKQTVLRNCLETALDGTSTGYMCQGTNGSVDADYNCVFGMQGHYAASVALAGKSGHDITADPGFPDSTRGFLTWAAQAAGKADATLELACGLVLSRNGLDQDSNTQNSSLASSNVIAELIDWVRQGFKPQNPQLRTGDDGFVGALEPDDGRVDTLVINAFEKYLPGGTEENADANKYPIDTSGWTVTGVLTQGAKGKLVEEDGQWFYFLESPVRHSNTSSGEALIAESADAASLNMRNAQETRVLMIQVNIHNDATQIVVPERISGNAIAEGRVTFNAGTNSPAEYSLVIDDAIYPAGQMVTHGGCTFVLDMDPLAESSGLGAGGGIFSPRICPDNPDLMFLSCDMGGVYRSIDGGAHWKLINWRILNSHHRGPGTLFCKNNLIWPGYGITSDTYKIAISHDTGVSWQVETALSAPICGVPWREGALVGHEQHGLRYYLHGEDFGQTWTGWSTVFESSGKVPAIAVIDDSSFYYIYNGRELKKTTKTGAGAPTFESVCYFGSEAVALAFDGFQLLVSQPATGVYRSIDLGKTWEPTGTAGMRHTDVYTIFIHPAEPDCYYLAQTTGLGNGRIVWKTVDCGKCSQSIFTMHADGGTVNVEQTWLQADLQWSYIIVPNGFEVLPGATPAEDVVMVSTQGELFRSDDGGKNFYAPVYANRRDEGGLDMHDSIGLEVTSVWGLKEDPFTPGKLHALYTDVGAGLSLDNGKSWAGVSRTLSWRNTMYGIAFDPDVQGKTWCACSRLHDIPHWDFIRNVIGEGAVNISTDGGKTWSLPYAYDAPGALPKWTCCDVVVDPASPVEGRTLYAAMYSIDPYTYEHDGIAEARGNDYGGVWKSTDGGNTWQKKNTGLQTGNLNKHVYRLNLAPSGNLYAMITGANTTEGILDGGIYVSSDGAESWSFVGPHESNLRKWVTSFTFGESEQEIYCTTVTAWGNSSKGGLHRTLDGGRTWETIFDDAALKACNAEDGVEMTYDHYMSVYVEGDFIMLGGTRSGCTFSYDRGKSWKSWTEFPFSSVQSINKLSDGRLALTSFGAGIFFTAFPPRSGHTAVRTGKLIARPAPVQQTVEVRAVNSEGIETRKQTSITVG